MTVHTAAQYLHGVVQVHAFQVFEPHDAVQLRERLLARLGRTQVVTCGESVAGVDADAYARLVLHAVDQVGQLFEGEAQIGPLSRRILDYGRHAVRLVQRDVDRLGDPVERLFGRDLLQVASGMEVQTVQPQLLATLHLVEKRRPRALPPATRLNTKTGTVFFMECGQTRLCFHNRQGAFVDGKVLVITVGNGTNAQTVILAVAFGIEFPEVLVDTEPGIFKGRFHIDFVAADVADCRMADKTEGGIRAVRHLSCIVFQ